MRLLSIFFVFAGSAAGWGCEGHQIVALIARAHLNSRASAAADRLLAGHPADPALKRFCAMRMTDKSAFGDALAEAASWADDVRADRKNGPWHYIDIPREETEPLIAKYCPPLGPSVDGKDAPGCVLNAIQYNLGILKDSNAPGSARADALRYLVHFVGDLHQPLHTTDNNDHGGNCTLMQFYDLDHPTNLHAIWDYNLIEHDVAARHVSVAADAQAIDRKFAANWKDWGFAAMDLNGWAWEGHGIANDVVYGKLTPPIAVEKADPQASCPAETQKVQDLQITIGDDYQNAVLPAVEAQLAKAGYRLAGILNTIWP